MAQRGVIELFNAVRAVRSECVVEIAKREKKGMIDSLYWFWHWGQFLKECYINRSVEAGLFKSRTVWREMTTSEGLLPTTQKRAMHLLLLSILTNL